VILRGWVTLRLNFRLNGYDGPLDEGMVKIYYNLPLEVFLRKKLCNRLYLIEIESN